LYWHFKEFGYLQRVKKRFTKKPGTLLCRAFLSSTFAVYPKALSILPASFVAFLSAGFHHNKMGNLYIITIPSKTLAKPD